MRNILQFSLVFLCFLAHLTEALFFGPVAVGLGVGILALKKGFLIGTALSGSRTRFGEKYFLNNEDDQNIFTLGAAINRPTTSTDPATTMTANTTDGTPSPGNITTTAPQNMVLEDQDTLLLLLQLQLPLPTTMSVLEIV